MSAAQSLQRADPIHIGRPLKFQDLDAFQQAIEAYFAERDALEKPYTMHGLARALDCSRTTLLNYERYDDAPAFMVTVKRARERVAEWTEDRLHQKGYHPAGAIFSLKNNFGWKDVQTHEVSIDVSVGIQASDDQRRGLLPDVVLQQVAPPIAPALEGPSPTDSSVIHRLSEEPKGSSVA
jgi:DNA-packaging protein gp3